MHSKTAATVALRPLFRCVNLAARSLRVRNDSAERSSGGRENTAARSVSVLIWRKRDSAGEAFDNRYSSWIQDSISTVWSPKWRTLEAASAMIKVGEFERDGDCDDRRTKRGSDRI